MLIDLLTKILFEFLDRVAGWVMKRKRRRAALEGHALLISWREVGTKMEQLIAAVHKNTRPDQIIGINRGGSIVGGMIAKSLDSATDRKQNLVLNVIRVKTNPESAELQCTNMPEGPEPECILLCDDSQRSGSHLRIALSHLRSLYPRAEINTVVLLKCAITQGPDAPAPPHVTYSGIEVHGEAHLPWDAKYQELLSKDR